MSFAMSPRRLGVLIFALTATTSPLLIVRGHAGHDHIDPSQLGPNGEDLRTYAEKHMASEHHIEAWDSESFFHLHDLNRDGILQVAEIEAIYGLHHPMAHKKAAAEAADHAEMRHEVVRKVLAELDTNGDGVVSLEEFRVKGAKGLPDFEQYAGHYGHHYDEESEYALHHEEIYHSTPETQTDESYNHPEDIEHFANHHAIEHEEDDRERRFEGLAEGADLSEDRVVQDPLDEHAHGSQDEAIIGGGAAPQRPFADLPRRPPGGTSRPSRMTGEELAAAAKDDIYDELERAKKAAGIMPGYGEDHFHRPKTAAEKLRKNAPYKSKFKSGRARSEF